MRILFLLIVLSNFIFAQYNSTMFDLIKTTYKRSFDNQIISQYLHSNSEQKTKAALLSISQSEDTTFVSDILELDLNEYGSEVCFALAQIGKCQQSLSFLWNYLKSSAPKEQYPKILFAIGKIGNENDLKKVVEFYNSFVKTQFPYDGISEAILQFQIRGIKTDEAKLILENEVRYKLSSNTRVALALFTLVRYGGTNSILNIIESILSEQINDLSPSDRLHSIDFDTITKIRQFSLIIYLLLNHSHFMLIDFFLHLD